MRRYGSLWQDLRAYVATLLFSCAHKAHSDATVDLARWLVLTEHKPPSEGGKKR